MAGRPKIITAETTLPRESWGRRLSLVRETVVAQLPLREWPGLVLAPLEWGALVARLVLALSTVFVALQVETLRPAYPSVFAGVAAIFTMTPVYIVLLRRRRLVLALTLSVISDGVIVIGAILGSGWLLWQAGYYATPSETQGINGSVPIIFVVMLSVLRLKTVPGVLYAVFVPLAVMIIMRILGTDPLGFDGAIPRTISMMFAGFAMVALAYPIQRVRTDLMRAVDEKVELVSTVAHELRGPLTSTRAYIELIRDEAAGEVNDSQRSMLDRAMRSTTRMDQLIGLFLHVERAENDRLKPVLESFDLATVAREVVDSVAPLASDREITIEFQNVDALPVVIGERQSADQVISNLLSNAVKFSPDDSIITVAGYLEGGHAGLTVTDHGVGISIEDQRHIFQRFYRSEDPRKRRVRGTGLGLYVSRRLMEKMGGRIWFYSVPGDGSTFGFSLPTEARTRASGGQPTEEVVEETTQQRPSEASV